MYKVLITCPPMLLQIDSLREKFTELNIEITTPKVVQTLSVSELIEIVPEHDGWIIGDDPATKEVFEAGKLGRLKAAVKWGIGTDNVDFKACKELNIPITNTPGMFGDEVADLAMCYILGLARDAFYIDREVRKGLWPKPTGISLLDKTLGIVGLGDIGKSIAKRANAHGLNIVGWDPYAKDVPEAIHFQKSWPDGLKQCNFLVFSCALTENNYHMFSEKIFGEIKSGLRIVNVSRGGLIDEDSLIKGISSGLIHSVALDVFENEPLNVKNKLLSYSNCIFGSHNGSNTKEAVIRASNEAINIIKDFLHN
tara:strand:+ start:268 stop:1197 length:930 start_codon:yes stop_codon:yes gene_type:complete